MRTGSFPRGVALGAVQPPAWRHALLLLLALVAGLPAAARAQSSDDDPGDARITGRVVSGFAELLPDTAVTLVGGPPPARTWTTTSGSRGEFAFEALPAGSYALTATRPGFTSRELLDAGGFRSVEEITLGAGSQVTEVELTLRRAASIAGRIVRPDGTPAPGTQVVPAVRSGDRQVLLFEARTTSEWDGRYEISGLPPGEFLIAVLPAAPDAPPLASPLPLDVAAPVNFAPTLYPGVPQSEPGDTVAVYEGVATEGIDIWLLPAPQRFAVSGRVFWPDDVGEVERIVIEYGGSPGVRSGIWYVDDPGGLFTLTGISQGTLVMLARAESDRGPLSGIVSTDVLLGPVEDVRLTLARPGSVAGRLVYERALPAESSPRVTLTHTLLTVSPLFPPEEAAVDANGRFAITPALGEYIVDVRDLPPGWSVRRILRNGRALDGRELLVDNGDAVSGLEIVVGPGPS